MTSPRSPWLPPRSDGPIRTGTSMLRGVQANVVSSGYHFQWTEPELEYFRAYNSSDRGVRQFHLLLRRLNLHGYEDVTNHQVSSVHALIVGKVRRKARSVMTEGETPLFRRLNRRGGRA